jgi:Domain of unknown function (DUF4338)
MKSDPANDAAWTELRPRLASNTSRQAFLAYVRALLRTRDNQEHAEMIAETRESFIETVCDSKRTDRQALLAAGLVVTDLVTQGWQLRVGREGVSVRPAEAVSDNHIAEKARIRRQELVKRDAQLRQPAVLKFLRSMERTRLFNGKFISIFSVMRDGRELAAGLRYVREHINNGWAGRLANVTDPYLEFVSSEEATCSCTGLRLMDIWRYFRHTWTNQYVSVPGRTMMFLVRDRAARFHPIIGIGALSSPVMQIHQRDVWIGWQPETFLARAKTSPTSTLARWLVKVVDTAISEIYVEDLLRDEVLSIADFSNPSNAAVEKLLTDSAEQRRRHHRFSRSRDHKSKRPAGLSLDFWAEQARTHLFRSKRALALALYLRARAVFKEAFGTHPTGEKLAALASTAKGSEAVRNTLRKAKADRLGIAVADLTVCGAIQPYNGILGGKLVAMLAASPEVVSEYGRRYGSAESQIASSMAGRPIVREPNLVLLGTTSLYGVGSSQYNRISIPCDRLNGSPTESIRYQELGHSRAFGTSQYSDETVNALTDLVQQADDGRRVNSIFGEGISPRFRKVRQGLDLLNFPSEVLLRHHRPRVVYAVGLVRNVGDYLLGIETAPSYLVPLNDGGTAQVAAWWRERWLRKRIASDEVLAQVAKHTLIHPICHGARVTGPRMPEQTLLFGEISDC